MKIIIFLFSATLIFAGSVQAKLRDKSPVVIAPTAPLVIGHRGAPGYRPEHTLASYKVAIEMGADYIEPDLVMTKDHVLIARHENDITETTDAAQKFPNRKKTKKVDGKEITGFFVEDFTLTEVKTLKAKERLPFRDQSYNGQFDIPTFKEILQLVKTESKKRKRLIGVYPETKHPSYFKSIDLPLEEAVIADLTDAGFNKKNSPVFIQSFELSSLKKLRALTELPLIFLIDDPAVIPYDFVLEGKKTTYLDLLKPASLKELSQFINGIGPHKNYIFPFSEKGQPLPETSLIADAHAVGLKVHPYTFRSEEKYLAAVYNKDPQNEYLLFFQAGVDGLFSDFSDQAVLAKNTYLKTLNLKESKTSK